MHELNKTVTAEGAVEKLGHNGSTVVGMGFDFLLVASGFLVAVVHAWWDEGHLVVAAVARLQLNDAAVEALEDHLHGFDTSFPGLGSVVTSAVWMDHLKCQRVSEYCRGTATLDGIEPQQSCCRTLGPELCGF